MTRTSGSAEPSRAKRLKALTHEVHDTLDKSVMAGASFDSVAGYGRFARMQWAFHRDIDALYDDARLQAALPGLPERRRLGLIEADLADLGLKVPEDIAMPAFGKGGHADLPTSLGWLYVAEGSNLGAAILRQHAARLGLSDDRGARHLAPAGGGPAAHWRAFVAALDAVELTSDEERRVAQGAQAAFARVQALAETCLV